MDDSTVAGISLRHAMTAPQRPGTGALLPDQRGIALVVTLILLSVVTFLAVAFLFLARRERGAVATTVALTAARRGTDAANDQARARIMAALIDSKNQFNYGLMVSTNFINAFGFIPGGPEFTSLTNVNYDYLSNGSTNFTIDQRNRNIANLYYSPRPPVFVRTDRVLNTGDFRFYHDLNNSGRFDTNGLLPELLNSGRLEITFDTNGNRITLSNFYVGDPEWVGILERPDRPHSASNKFVGRYCYIVVPSGKTLDFNSIHNQSKFPRFTVDGFSRNMGVGPWELNLASGLVDLNTNVWWRNPGGGFSLPTALIDPVAYAYDTSAFSSQGTAFEDALGILRYRYGGNWNNLKSVSGMFGPAGETGFQTDGADGYGSGPLLLTNTVSPVDGDTPARVRLSWPGAENPRHFFTTQDLLDPTKTAGDRQLTPNTFSDRLLNAGRYGYGSYDRYTYYRFLSQFGLDTPPDPTVTNKIHLNYVNVNNAGQVIPDAQTNFVSWSDPLLFFTNAVDRLLRATFTDTNDNQRNFGVTSVLSLTNIPVFVSNKFVYSPSLHRALQVTANIWDASTNRVVPNAAVYPFLPSVFRPVFRTQPNPTTPSITDIYIRGFEEVKSVPSMGSDPQLARPMDLNDPSDRASAIGLASAPPSGRVLNIYGVPWVIGAKKGFPNFNEFAMQSISQMSRKLQFRRQSVADKPYATNQMFILGVSNTFAFEAWNSYQANYSRDVQIIVANDMSMNLTFTNDINPVLDGRNGFEPRPPSPIFGRFSVTTNVIDIPANVWQGSGPRTTPVKASFLVPLQTNIVLLPDSIYRTEPQPYFTGNSNVGVNVFLGFEQTKKFPIPQFNFSVSNRIRFIMIDKETKRIVDYVQLGGLNGVRDLTTESAESAASFVDGTTRQTRNEAIFWDPNRLPGKTVSDIPEGVNNQIRASKGEINVPDWRSFGIGQANGQTKLKEIDEFRVFMGLSPLTFPGTVNTNIVTQAPFTPTRKSSQYITWQANDPLVHYTAGDLAYVNLGTGVVREQPGGSVQPLKNMGVLNDRFEPWGGNPQDSSLQPNVPKFSLETKDPGVKKSDNWDFPTNKFATLGLIGRVHRGTPWQTVYLKANDIGNAQWAKWTGNSNSIDASYSKPIRDRAIVDVFTTAIDQNTTRGQLNVNQTGIAAWSALLGGVIGLTNASTQAEIETTPPIVRLEPFVIDPAGKDPAGPTNSILGKIHAAVDRTRTARFNGSFKRLGDILAVPELTTASPLLNTNSLLQLQEGISDAVYERLPQQLLGLMRGGDQPSFTIYAYGQALHPANRSIVTASGPYFGLCTNYQITAEFATRTEVEVQNAPTAPKVVVKSYNILPPE